NDCANPALCAPSPAFWLCWFQPAPVGPRTWRRSSNWPGWGRWEGGRGKKWRTVGGGQWAVMLELPSDRLPSLPSDRIGGATSRSPADEQELVPPRHVIASP